MPFVRLLMCEASPLYEELYVALRAIDPGLADRVTLSISY